MRPVGVLRRLRRHRDDEDLWQITFADLVTLILTFFIILVSISKVDFVRYERVVDSMGKAMGQKQAERAPSPAEPLAEERKPVEELPPEEIRARYRKVETLNAIMAELEYQLQLDHDSVALERREDAIALNLWGGVFFKSGSAELTEKAVILSIISDALAGLPYNVTVEGHTDNIPINTRQFPSNWELSAARAAAVARFLIDHGLDAHQVKIVGLADTHPLAPNQDDQGRPQPENMKLNRRVVILVEM